MRESPIPYQKIVFVCTRARPDKAACANAARGDNSGTVLLEALRGEVEKRGLEGSVRVAQSGCMDLCAAGPNVMIFDGNNAYTWCSGVIHADIPALVDRHLQYPSLDSSPA